MGKHFSISAFSPRQGQFGTVFTDVTEQKRAAERLEQSLQKLQKTLKDTVRALAATAESRDPYTAGHQQRVAYLATAISRAMALPEEQVEGINVAAALHDIGKISVPIEILNKPGLLSDLELGLIKTHPRIGHDILRSVEFPWQVARIILQHHERMDGSGYPEGLAGEDILLEARILAVADVVEAMASHRPYRPPLGLDSAVDEIGRHRGIVYDGPVVDACLNLLTEEGFTFN
jgi:putative nucleotidyltransferase with HDIG domain